MSTDQTPPQPSVEPKEGVNQMEVTAPFTDNYIYSNISALSTSYMDLRISFGEVMPNGTPHAKVGVVIPLEHAAQLTMNLLLQLNFFEKNFGEIRHPQWRFFQEKAQANINAALKSKEMMTQPPEPEAKP